ncbi:heavy-metal-associated domain-containing protein [Stutzerimonas chloritidismutans]|uniref:heavy-metal-associated domain-containing protein n=1 Tax=Stutzerimonas chloritidismutans TaxID=203192 RepID=UPI003F189E61
MRTFQVTGMTCAHCERAVTQAIQAREPGAVVRVDLERGQVEVQGELSDQAIREAIEAEGYQLG